MWSRAFIFLFIFCASASIFSVHAADSAEVSSGSSDVSNTDNGGLFSSIMSLVKGIFELIWDVIGPVLHGIESFVMGILHMIFSSDDTSVATTNQQRSAKNSNGDSSSGGFSIMGMVKDIFLAPFKLTFGILHEISFSSLFEDVEDIVKPVVRVLNNPAVEMFMNTTMNLLESAGGEIWNFTKSTVLPDLNAAVTTLRNSNTLPKDLNDYLGDIQGIYNFCHMLGIM